MRLRKEAERIADDVAAKLSETIARYWNMSLAKAQIVRISSVKDRSLTSFMWNVMNWLLELLILSPAINAYVWRELAESPYSLTER